MSVALPPYPHTLRPLVSYKTFHELLGDLARNAGTPNPAQLAEIVGADRSTVQRWLTGQSYPGTRPRSAPPVYYDQLLIDHFGIRNDHAIMVRWSELLEIERRRTKSVSEPPTRRRQERAVDFDDLALSLAKIQSEIGGIDHRATEAKEADESSISEPTSDSPVAPAPEVDAASSMPKASVVAERSIIADTAVSEAPDPISESALTHQLAAGAARRATSIGAAGEEARTTDRHPVRRFSWLAALAIGLSIVAPALGAIWYGSNLFDRWSRQSRAPDEPRPLRAAPNKCDLLASAPHNDDSTFPGSGRTLLDLQARAVEAVAACEEAYSASPKDPRMQFQLGRSLIARYRAGQSSALDDAKRGFRLVSVAWGQGYWHALPTHIANLVYERGTSPDPAQAWRLISTVMLPADKREQWDSQRAAEACAYLYDAKIPAEIIGGRDPKELAVDYCLFSYNKDTNPWAAGILTQMYDYGVGKIISRDKVKASEFARESFHSAVPWYMANYGYYHQAKVYKDASFRRAISAFLKANARSKETYSGDIWVADDGICNIYFEKPESELDRSQIGSLLSEKDAVEACARAANSHRKAGLRQAAAFYGDGRFAKYGFPVNKPLSERYLSLLK